MNINLVYEGKDYNFDVPNGVTIDYLKELSSKIFNSEKELLDLIYNNEKVKNNDDKTLIRDLIPDGETNAVLTVQINRNLKNNSNNNSKQIVPLVNLKQKNIESIIKEADENIPSENNEKKENKKKKKNEKRNKDNLEYTGKEINNSDDQRNGKENRNTNSFKTNANNNNNNKTNNNNSKMKLIFNSGVDKKSNNNYNNILEKDFSKKILFEMTYIKKNNELLSLIKEFNEKIKKIHLILYKKFKTSGAMSHNISSFSSNNTSRSSINISINNNYFYELSLYEKKLINFQEKQIQFYKSLLEIMKNYDNNINLNKLNEFYNKLIIFSIIDNNNINITKFKPIKLTKIPNKQLINSNSSINLSTSNTINTTNKLPLINTKIINCSNSPAIKEKSRNILTNNVNRINSFSSSYNKNFNQINENKENKIKLNNNIINNNKEINNSKITKNNYAEDNNKNKTINKNNSKKNLNNNDLLSQSSSSENNDNLGTNIPNSKNSIYNSVNNNINYVSPISIYRKETKSNFKVRKLSDRYNNEMEYNNNNNNDEKSKWGSVKSLNKYKNINDKRINIEDFKKNENFGGYKLKKVKDINISTMTVNDSNFAREKHSSPRKNKKDTLDNKYDFLV